MRFLLILCFALVNADNPSIDFGKTKMGSQWRIVNDDVMGGRSVSTATLQNDALYFKGNVSLENNGGFASVRSPYGTYDLSNFSEIVIRHKGTARKFALTFTTDKRWFMPNYRMEFYPSETWQETIIPIKSLKESRIGEYTGETIPEEKISEIIQTGIILYDKKEGAFELEVDYIKFR